MHFKQNTQKIKLILKINYKQTIGKVRDHCHYTGKYRGAAYLHLGVSQQ